MAALRNRALEPGLTYRGGASMSLDFQEWHDRWRGRNIGMQARAHRRRWHPSLRKPAVMVQYLAKAAADARADDKRQMGAARADLHQGIAREDGIVLWASATHHSTSVNHG